MNYSFIGLSIHMQKIHIGNREGDLKLLWKFEQEEVL